MIQLSDDGTLDTVLRCSCCGEEFRYNFDPELTDDDTVAEEAYDQFVDWAFDDAGSEHECPVREAV